MDGTLEPKAASADTSRLHTFVRPMLLAMVLVGGAWAAPVQADELEYEPDVVLVIKEKAFHMVKGNAPKENSLHPAFSLSPGADVTLELRNEDRIPHEFVSPLFAKVEFQFWGKATVVSRVSALHSCA